MFRCTLLASALLLPAPVTAQVSVADSSRVGVIAAFENSTDIYGGWLVAAFDSIPGARYDYRPAPPQRTIGNIAQHLETANYGLCGSFGHMTHATTAKDSLPESIKARWPKDTLVARLKASFSFCDSALARVSSLGTVNAIMLVAFETDLAEHYSQLSSYMRLLNMVPPSALKPKKRTAIDMPASALATYAGEYEVFPGLSFDVSAHDGALWITSNSRESAAQALAREPERLLPARGRGASDIHPRREWHREWSHQAPVRQGPLRTEDSLGPDSVSTNLTLDWASAIEAAELHQRVAREVSDLPRLHRAAANEIRSPTRCNLGRNHRAIRPDADDHPVVHPRHVPRHVRILKDDRLDVHRVGSVQKSFEVPLRRIVLLVVAIHLFHLRR